MEMPRLQPICGRIEALVSLEVKLSDFLISGFIFFFLSLAQKYFDFLANVVIVFFFFFFYFQKSIFISWRI